MTHHLTTGSLQVKSLYRYSLPHESVLYSSLQITREAKEEYVNQHGDKYAVGKKYPIRGRKKYRKLLCGDNKFAKEHLLLIACVFHDTNGW